MNKICDGRCRHQETTADGKQLAQHPYTEARVAYSSTEMSGNIPATTSDRAVSYCVSIDAVKHNRHLIARCGIRARRRVHNSEHLWNVCVILLNRWVSVSWPCNAMQFDDRTNSTTTHTYTSHNGHGITRWTRGFRLPITGMIGDRYDAQAVLRCHRSPHTEFA